MTALSLTDSERMVMDAITEEAAKEGLKSLLLNNVSQDTTSERWYCAIEYKGGGNEGSSRTLKCAIVFTEFLTDPFCYAESYAPLTLDICTWSQVVQIGKE